MDYFIMALLVMAENIKGFLNGICSTLPLFLGIIGLFVMVFWSFIRVICNDNDWNEKDENIYKTSIPTLKKITIACFIISFVLSFLGAITPNMKQAAMIYTVPKIINNKHIQSLPDNVLILFNESIKELTAVVKGEATSIAKDITKQATEEAKIQIKEVAKTITNKEKKL